MRRELKRNTEAEKLFEKSKEVIKGVKKKRKPNNHYQYRRLFEYAFKQHNVLMESLIALAIGLITVYFILPPDFIPFLTSAGIMIVLGMEVMKFTWGFGPLKPYYRKSYIDIYMFIKQYLYIERLSMGLIVGGFLRYYFRYNAWYSLNPITYFNISGLIFGLVLAGIYIYEIGFKDRFVTPERYEELMTEFEEIHNRVAGEVGIRPQNEAERFNDLMFFIENHRGEETAMFEKACNLSAYAKKSEFIPGIDSGIYSPYDAEPDEDYEESEDSEVEIRRGR